MSRLRPPGARLMMKLDAAAVAADCGEVRKRPDGSGGDDGRWITRSHERTSKTVMIHNRI